MLGGVRGGDSVGQVLPYIARAACICNCNIGGADRWIPGASWSNSLLKQRAPCSMRDPLSKEQGESVR